VQTLDSAEQLHQLGAGAADILCSLLHINRPACYNEVLARFLSNLGFAPDASSITVTQARDTWHFEDAWTPDRPSPVQLHPSLEAQLAHLCLLFPFQGANPDPTVAGDVDDPTTFHLLTSLLTTLTKADYSAAPRAGLAFLQTIRNIDFRSALISPLQGPGNPFAAAAAATRNALLRLMLAQLEKTLERIFPDAPR
jgi:hypothetical protein